MANQGVHCYPDFDEMEFPVSIDKQSIAGDMKCIETQDAVAVLQNTASIGKYVYVGKFKRIVGWMTADQTGSLTIVQSDDGYTDRYTTTIATAIGGSDAFNIEIVLPFVTVIWTEGNTAAATLNLWAFAKML